LTSPATPTIVRSWNGRASLTVVAAQQAEAEAPADRVLPGQ
jgi:hypothetical protein